MFDLPIVDDLRGSRQLLDLAELEVLGIEAEPIGPWGKSGLIRHKGVGR
jgi:hypothetical protein